MNLLDFRDAAQAIHMCMKRNELKNRTFNVGSNDTIHLSDIINRIV